MAIDAWDIKAKTFKERIKQLRFKTFHLYESETENVDLDGIKTYSCEYDPNGNIIHEAEYGLNGEIDWICVYSYDDKQRLIEEKFYADDNVVDGRIVYHYNDKSQIIQSIEYDPNDEVEHKTLFIYENDLLVKEMHYDNSDTIVSSCINEYNDKKQKIKVTEFDLENQPVAKITYDYDNNGNLICEKIYTLNDDIETLDSIITYKYDNNNNLIERQIKNSEEMLVDKIEYKYDNNGNILEEKVTTFENSNESYCECDNCDESSITQFSTKYVYEYDNNGNIIKEIEYEIDENENLIPLVYSKHKYEFYA